MPSNRILICPLDWGLGHATRCIPIIRALLERNCEVHLASSGRAADLLRLEFPSLPLHILPSFAMTYPRKAWLMPLQLLMALPRILRASRAEHRVIETLHHQHKFSLIISDNRFGCFLKEVPSIYITHQILIPFPAALRFCEPLGHLLHARVQSRFRETWIPDWPEAPGLSGRMGHGSHIQARHRHVGPLARFRRGAPGIIIQDIDILICLSGPEPQRTLLEETLLRAFAHYQGVVFLLRGVPGGSDLPEAPINVKVLPHASGEHMELLLRRSKLILTRSGYTTVMELATLGARAVFIPTPGQEEQVYLAKTLQKRGWAGYIPQENFSLDELLRQAEGLSGFPAHPYSEELLDSALNAHLS